MDPKQHKRKFLVALCLQAIGSWATTAFVKHDSGRSGRSLKTSYCAVFAVQSLLCCLCYAVFAMQSSVCNLLCTICFAVFAIVGMQSLLCTLCCAVCAVQSLLCWLGGCWLAGCLLAGWLAGWAGWPGLAWALPGIQDIGSWARQV